MDPYLQTEARGGPVPSAGARQARRWRQRYLGGVGQGAGSGGPTWPRDTELCEGGSGQVQIGRPGTKLERIGDAVACCRGTDGDAEPRALAHAIAAKAALEDAPDLVHPHPANKKSPSDREEYNGPLCKRTCGCLDCGRALFGARSVRRHDCLELQHLRPAARGHRRHRGDADFYKKESNGASRSRSPTAPRSGPERQAPESIKSGGYEGALMCAGYYPNKFPLLTVMELPFLPPRDIGAQRKGQSAQSSSTR